MPSRRSSLFSPVLAFLILFLALPALAGNWGENWDEMVWGLPVSVPSVPAVGLFVLALLTTAVWRLRARKAWHSALAILVVPMLAGVLSSPAHAQVAVPNTFTNGDIAGCRPDQRELRRARGGFEYAELRNPRRRGV